MKKPTKEDLKDFFKSQFGENEMLSEEDFEKAVEAFYSKFYEEDRNKPNPDIMVIL